MKKLAKLFLLVLVFALMASVLVACGEDKTTPNKPSTPTVTPGNPTEQTGKEEPTVTPDEPTHVHAFGEWKVITSPTCTVKGLKKRTCKCGEEETEEIKALGHDIIHHEGKEPTCTEEGYKAYDTCSRCDYTTYETLPITHRYNDWQVSASPTCTSGGIETRACSVCGTIERRSVDALGHNYGEWKTTKEPTCTETGEKESICSRCNDVQKQTLSALGHSFGDWVVTKEATCQKGSEERACSVCGYVEKKDIPADYTTHIFEGDFCTVCGEHKGTEGLQFELVTNDIVAVTGYTGSSTTVYIPSSYVGATVTSIKAEAFKDDTTITEIVIPDSVTSIGNNAFYNCSSLTSITIPDSVTSIGDYAFYNCPIETATIPAIACSYVKNSNLKTVVITSGERIGDSSFSGCSSLTSITLPDSVTGIGDFAFYECSNLTSVCYKGDIASWCGITFSNFWSNPLYCAHNLYINNELIKDIVIPDTVTGIKAYAFEGWTGTSITIPDSVTSIGSSAFYNCPIETATIPAFAISYIPKDNLKTVVITSGKSIGNSAFSYCRSLTSITIPDSVTSIGEEAFYNCSGLTSITLGNSITSIGDQAFDRCERLTSVYYTGDIASWCGITFDGGANPLIYAHNLYIDNELIKDIVIPDTVTEIKYCAFCGWNGTSITIPDSVTSIGPHAFIGYNGPSITIPDSVTSIGEEAFYNCSRLTSITLPDSVTSIESGTFRGCSSLTSITLGNSVTSIGNSAFSYCRSLTSITIPDSVTSIGNEAFRDCSSLQYNEYDNGYYLGNDNNPYMVLVKAKDTSITSCTIHENTKFIHSYAFFGCSSLTSITLPDSVTSIGGGAFHSCSSLTSITLPDSVRSIGSEAFNGCSSLTSITIPDSVTSIGDYAFYNCSGLTSITFQGTKAQWNAISKGDNWDYYTGNYTVHCTDDI